MSQAWPIETRLSASDFFEMIETAERDPKAFGPEIRAARRRAARGVIADGAGPSPLVARA